jgi:hypothetical protein
MSSIITLDTESRFKVIVQVFTTHVVAKHCFTKSIESRRVKVLQSNDEYITFGISIRVAAEAIEKW